MKPDPTRNTRAARYRAATKEAGGVRVDVHIGPEAAAALAKMRETMTVREAIEAALIKSRATTGIVARVPRSYEHTLIVEGQKVKTVATKGAASPFGIPGEDHSGTVETMPLYA